MPHTLITGGSSGLGAALAVELARHGHDVGLLARREAELNEVAERVRALGQRACVAVCDVTDKQAVHEAVATCIAELGPVDVAVANAGSSGRVLAKELDASAAEAVLRLNLFGALYLYEAVLPDMVARGSGQIVGVASLAGLVGLPKESAYSASKAALQALLDAFRLELRRKGVAVTTINPGFVRTPLTEGGKNLPFLWEVDRAARVMARGILAREAIIEFPWQLSWVLRLARLAPTAVSDWIVGRLV